MEPQSSSYNTYTYNQTGVTVTDREVKTGTETTLTCSLTELTVEVVISWSDGQSAISDGNNGTIFSSSTYDKGFIFKFLISSRSRYQRAIAAINIKLQ